MAGEAMDLADKLALLRASFGLTPSADAGAAPDGGAVSEALDRAALSGAFDLHAITGFAPAADRVALREALSQASAPALVEGRRLRWLNADSRRTALVGLFSRPDRLHALLGKLRLDRADAAGRALRDLLRGLRPDPRRTSDARLAAFETALGWLDGLAPPPTASGAAAGPLPDAGAIRQEIAERARKEEQAAVLPEGFVGRRAELATIRGFLDDAETAGQILLLTGPGGIGKSALLARASRVLAKRDPALLVLSFDFDRPALDPRGPGLTLELTRQLALRLPDAADDLAQVRALVRDTFRQSGGEVSYAQRGIDSAARATSEAAYLLRSVLGRAGLEGAPALVLLDTLEVIIAEGESALGALGAWLRFLVTEAGLRGARVVIAGRAAEAAAERLDAVRSEEILPLAQGDAARLLRRMRLPAARADAAAALLGGNPLVLRLGGRYLLEYPDRPVSDLAEGGAGEGVLTQGVLYRRILDHIGTGPDDPLRRLAYPGLALRVVTPRIVAEVLAPALDLPIAGDGAVRDLWSRLLAQAWLVEPETERRVRHRRDLREVMLRLMRGDAAMAGPVARLHARALAYHRRADDPDVPADRAAREAVYHALMLLPPGAELAAADQPIVGAAMGGDFGDLPGAAAALARHYARSSPLRDDAALLPAAYRSAVLSRLAWAEIDADRPDAALTLPGDEREVTVWRLTAWHDAGDWDAPDVGAALSQDEPAGGEGRDGRLGWRAVCAFLRLWRDEAAAIRAPDAEALRAVDSLPPLPRFQLLRASAAWGLACLLRGDLSAESWDALDYLSRSAPPDGRDPAGQAVEDEIGRLRLLLWQAGRLAPDAQIPLTSAMILPTPPMLARYVRAAEAIPAARRMLEDLAAAPPEPATTARLTGAYARSIVKALGAAGADRVQELAAAGLRPADLANGVMTDLRPAARSALRAALAEAAPLAAFASRLPTLLAPGAALPADLEPERWCAAARGADASRAIAALVDWAGRSGRLAGILDAAAVEAGGAGSRLGRVARAQRRIDTALATGADLGAMA